MQREVEGERLSRREREIERVRCTDRRKIDVERDEKGIQKYESLLERK